MLYRTSVYIVTTVFILNKAKIVCRPKSNDLFFLGKRLKWKECKDLIELIIKYMLYSILKLIKDLFVRCFIGYFCFSLYEVFNFSLYIFLIID